VSVHVFLRVVCVEGLVASVVYTSEPLKWPPAHHAPLCTGNWWFPLKASSAVSHLLRPKLPLAEGRQLPVWLQWNPLLGWLG